MWKRGQSPSGGRTSGVTCEEELPVRGMGDPRGAGGHKGSRTYPGVLLVWSKHIQVVHDVWPTVTLHTHNANQTNPETHTHQIRLIPKTRAESGRPRKTHTPNILEPKTHTRQLDLNPNHAHAN